MIAERLEDLRGADGRIGGTVRHRLRLPERRIDHQPDRVAELHSENPHRRRPWEWLLGRSVRAVQHGAFAGPLTGSNGLESGRNYMKGCSDKLVDLAIARDIRFGGGRSFQLRADIFNAFNTVIYSGRQTQLQLNSPTDPTIRNSQFNADGTLNQTGSCRETPALVRQRMRRRCGTCNCRFGSSSEGSNRMTNRTTDTEIGRRDFARMALGTLGVAALGGRASEAASAAQKRRRRGSSCACNRRRIRPTSSCCS